MSHTTKPVSPLRQRMIEDMALRKLAPKTQSHYLRAVINLTCFLGRSPDTASPEDLRRYQLHLVETGISRISLNHTITALRFFFGVTLDHAEVMAKMSSVREPRKLPVVLSREEVARLIDAAGKPKYQAVLSVAYGAGLRASEVIALKKARAARTVMRCSHRCCFSACVSGGKPPMPKGRCSTAAGCSPGRTPSTR
jgi:integrase/recombinase XerD